jgi:hypothetical protein
LSYRRILVGGRSLQIVGAGAQHAFLPFGLQSAVIFLNKFLDLICDPEKF